MGNFFRLNDVGINNVGLTTALLLLALNSIVSVLSPAPCCTIVPVVTMVELEAIIVPESIIVSHMLSIVRLLLTWFVCRNVVVKF